MLIVALVVKNNVLVLVEQLVLLVGLVVLAVPRGVVQSPLGTGAAEQGTGTDGGLLAPRLHGGAQAHRQLHGDAVLLPEGLLDGGENVHADGTGFEREQGYKYPHSYPNRWVKQQYLPDNLKNAVYYEYGDNKTEQAAKEYEGSGKIAKVDIDNSPELAVKYNVSTVPHVVVFSDGKVIYEGPGTLTKPEILEFFK